MSISQGLWAVLSDLIGAFFSVVVIRCAQQPHAKMVPGNLGSFAKGKDCVEADFICTAVWE